MACLRNGSGRVFHVFRHKLQVLRDGAGELGVRAGLGQPLQGIAQRAPAQRGILVLREVGGHRQEHFLPITAADDDQALAKLRGTVMHGVEYAMHCVVAQSGKLFEDVIEYGW